MTNSYTADQLLREAQLLVTEISNLADYAVGDGAGVQALGLRAGGHFDQTHHPDDLTEIDGMAVWEHITHIERYVRDQQWGNSLKTDIMALGLLVERIFSPTVLMGYDEEKRSYQESNLEEEMVVPGAHEDGTSDIPLGFFHHGILANLVATATARLKVDQDERLTMAEIALLLDVREATVITNAHRRNFPTVEDENRRYAESSEALPWMIKQGYLPTRLPAGKRTKATVQDVDSPEEALVFVPYARDGSWFSPECGSNGRFTIGPKGNESKYTDYFAALDALIRMPTPRWRRKNVNGNAGIVSGMRFDRVRRADIERALR